MAYQNIEDRRAYHKKWYRKNKQRRYELITANKKRIYDFLSEYKLGKGCTDCGYDAYAVALDFDHLSDDKLFDISTAPNMGYSMKRILNEIGKCEVVCANCHRVRTQNRIYAAKALAAMQ